MSALIQIRSLAHAARECKGGTHSSASNYLQDHFMVLDHFVDKANDSHETERKIYSFRKSLRNLPGGSYFLHSSTNSGSLS